MSNLSSSSGNYVVVAKCDRWLMYSALFGIFFVSGGACKCSAVSAGLVQFALACTMTLFCFSCFIVDMVKYFLSDWRFDGIQTVKSLRSVVDNFCYPSLINLLLKSLLLVQQGICDFLFLLLDSLGQRWFCTQSSSVTVFLSIIL